MALLSLDLAILLSEEVLVEGELDVVVLEGLVLVGEGAAVAVVGVLDLGTRVERLGCGLVYVLFLFCLIIQ